MSFSMTSGDAEKAEAEAVEAKAPEEVNMKKEQVEKPMFTSEQLVALSVRKTGRKE